MDRQQARDGSGGIFPLEADSTRQIQPPQSSLNKKRSGGNARQLHWKFKQRPAITLKQHGLKEHGFIDPVQKY
jgi:hypothetical protein